MILVAIGSNLNSKLFGSPEQNCNAAIDMLRKYFEVTQSSSFYKTEPIPKSEQPWFVNCIVNIKSKISPSRILDTLLEIELQFGRKRNRKNEARVIDLDLIRNPPIKETLGNVRLVEIRVIGNQQIIMAAR